MKVCLTPGNDASVNALVDIEDAKGGKVTVNALHLASEVAAALLVYYPPLYETFVRSCGARLQVVTREVAP